MRSDPVPDPWMQGAYRTEEGSNGMDTSNNAKPNNYFPQSEFLFFNQAVNAEKMSKKLKEFNSQVLEELRVEESLLDALPSLAT